MNINERLKGGCNGSVLAAAAIVIYFGVCKNVSIFPIFPPSQTLLHTRLQIMASFIIDCHCINLCIRIYTGISKYNQLSYFCVTFSRADHVGTEQPIHSLHCKRLEEMTTSIRGVWEEKSPHPLLGGLLPDPVATGISVEIFRARNKFTK